jgi:tetratricopeptide (TPR) repeat protein
VAVALIVMLSGFGTSGDARAVQRRWRELQDAVIAATDAGNPGSAISAAESALSLAVSNYKEPHAAIAESCRRLANAYVLAGEYAAAEAAAARGAENYRAILGRGNLETAAVEGEYGIILGRLGRFAQARPLLEDAIRTCEQLAGPEAAATATAVQNLADFNVLEGRHDAAIPLYERALEITTKTAGPAGLPTAAAMAGLGACLARGTVTDTKAEPAGREATERAEILLERSLLIQQRAAGGADRRVAPTLLHLAALRQAQNHLEQAEAWAIEALAIYEAHYGPRHPETAAALSRFAAIAKARGDLPLAQQCLDRAAVIRNSAFGLSHPETIAALDQLIDVLFARGDYKTAEKPCRARLHGLEKKTPVDTGSIRRSMEQLAKVLENTERADDAKTLLQRLPPATESPAPAATGNLPNSGRP